MRNLSFSVVSDKGSTIDVIYEGKRCAPSVTNEFSSTTVVSSDNSGDPVVNEGSVVFGEVVCSAIAPGFEGWTRIVTLDGSSPDVEIEEVIPAAWL